MPTYPKDKMVDIAMYVEDVLISHKDKGKPNFKWYARLKPRFNEFFGKGWKDPEREFWDTFEQKHIEA